MILPSSRMTGHRRCRNRIGFFITEENFNEELFIRHPNIRYLATLSHGYAEMDKALTQKYGVTVTNTIYGAEAIAEFTLGLLFDICKNVQTNSDIVKSTDWTDPQPGSWFIPATRQLEISGKTIGIIGLGNIGFQLARKSDALGMHVLGYSRTYKEGLAYQFIDQVSLEQLLEESDIISINTPLTSETYHLIDRAAIDQMKHGVILLNTARGEIIDELALTEALKSGKIYAAGLDVLSEEPPPKISNCSSWIMSESRSISHGVRRKQTCGPSKSPWIIWSITFRINLRV